MKELCDYKQTLAKKFLQLLPVCNICLLVVEDTVSSSVSAADVAPISDNLAAETEPAEMDIRIHEEEPATDAAADSSEESDTENVAEDSFSPKTSENGQFDIF